MWSSAKFEIARTGQHLGIVAARPTMAQIAWRAARAVFATLPAQSGLTNRKTPYAPRFLFAIPRDRARGVRQRHCDRCPALQDPDHGDWAASLQAIRPRHRSVRSGR